MQLLLFCLLIINLLGVFLLATRILESLKLDKDSDLYPATWLIILVLVIYGQVVLVGLFGLFNRLALSLANLLLILLFWRQTKPGLSIIAIAFNKIEQGFQQQRLLYLPVVLPLLIQVMTPIPCDDSLTYHLPNIQYFIQAGTTATYDTAKMYAPDMDTAYYTRGLEAVSAFFYQFAGSRHTILFFKYCLWFTLYFLISHISGNRRLAAILFAFVTSLEVVAFDLGGLKNDVILAILVVYMGVILIKEKDEGYLLPFAAAFSLALALKTNAVLYLIPLYALWLRRMSASIDTIIRLTLLLIVPLGLYFYIANLLQYDNPFYPFSLSLFGYPIFPGNSREDILVTTIIANIDWQLIPLFMRGLTRQVSPLGVMAMAVLLGLIGWQITKQRKLSTDDVLELLLLLWFAMAYIITPFSDGSSGIPHSHLFSGHSIRMALPLLLYLLIKASVPAAACAGETKTLKRLAVFVVFASLFNLVWYDAVTLAVKPENAFATLSPILLTFNNGYLLGLFVLLVIIVAGVNFRYGHAWLGVFLILAVGIYFVHFPRNYAYEARFKQIGHSSHVFEFLEETNLDDVTIGVHSNTNISCFLALLNAYLYTKSPLVKFTANPYQDEYDVLIVSTTDVSSTDPILGRNYSTSFDFFDAGWMPETYQQVFEDDFYIVYMKEGVLE